MLDDKYRPVQAILAYLKFLDDLGRSPNTIRAAALHLKTFWEFLGEEGLDWTEVDVAHLAAFIQWLRRSDSAVVSIEPRPPKRTNATIDLMLTSVHGLYEYHQRLHTIPDLPLYRFVMMPQRRYKPLLYGIAKTKPVQARSSYTIPCEEALMQLYTDYLIEDLGALETQSLPDYVFVNLWGGKLGQPMIYETVRSLVKHLCRRAHVHFTPHMLRHTRATIWLRDDKPPPATVARLLGHSSVQTTQDIYLELTPADLKRALKKEEAHGEAGE